jgi:hypothetical protein
MSRVFDEIDADEAVGGWTDERWWHPDYVAPKLCWADVANGSHISAIANTSWSCITSNGDSWEWTQTDDPSGLCPYHRAEIIGAEQLAA